MPNKNIDEIFREGLKGQKPPYDSRAWDGIKAQLAQKSGRGAKGRIIIGGTAFVLIALSLMIWHRHELNSDSTNGISNLHSDIHPQSNKNLTMGSSSVLTSNNQVIITNASKNVIKAKFAAKRANNLKHIY